MGFVQSYKNIITKIVTPKQNIAHIILNRPNVRNCVNPETALELVRAVQSFESDPNLKVAVLSGSEGKFCAGFDLKALAADIQVKEHIERWLNSGNELGPLGPTRRFIKKPMIAAVEGYAVAGGLELSLMCDLRVAAESATFGVFCRRFGVPLLDGGTVRLQAIIGLSRALDMILTGRPVGAEEALSFGLANRVVPEGKAVESAIELASEIASFPEECVLVDRESAYSCAFSQAMHELLRKEMELGSKVIEKESVKGAQSFSAGTGRHGSFSKL